MSRQLDLTEPLVPETSAERERLSDLYAGLGRDQWSPPSLCAAIAHPRSSPM